MRQIIQSMTKATNWQGRPGRRLVFSMLLAALLLAGVMSFLPYPASLISFDLAELRVQIVTSEPAASTELREPIPAEASEPATEPEPDTLPESGSAVQTADIAAPPVDWQTLGEEVARDVVRSHSQTSSVNPAFAEKRRVAAEQFRASRAPEKRFIWDNVEQDQTGRTLLWHGDCYRVLDDRSAVYHDIFETFTQYIVTCIHLKPAARELPWVADVRERYSYLQRQFDSHSGANVN